MEDACTRKSEARQGSTSWKRDLWDEHKTQTIQQTKVQTLRKKYVPHTQQARQGDWVPLSSSDYSNKWKESHRNTIEEGDHVWLDEVNERDTSITQPDDTKWHTEAPREYTWTQGSNVDQETTTWMRDKWLGHETEMHQKKKYKQSSSVTSATAANSHHWEQSEGSERVVATATSACKQPLTPPALQQPRTPPSPIQDTHRYAQPSHNVINVLPRSVGQHSEWRSDQAATNDNTNEALIFANLTELDTMRRCMKDDQQLSGLEHIAGFRDKKHMEYFRVKVRQLLTDVGDSRL